MHAMIVAFTDSEKTGYYTQFGLRHAAASIMEYIWSDQYHRAKFIEVNEKHAEDFSDFCNLLINDMNSLLFDGLLALEEIKNFEEMKEELETWNQLDEE